MVYNARFEGLSVPLNLIYKVHHLPGHLKFKADQVSDNILVYFKYNIATSQGTKEKQFVICVVQHIINVF